MAEPTRDQTQELGAVAEADGEGKATKEIKVKPSIPDTTSKESNPDASGKDGRRCVKVFELDTEGKWSDKGTGVVECVFVEPKEAMCLVVRSDTDNSVLLNSTIRNEVNYVRQQDTLIVWTEPHGEDLALSFQESAGCSDIWEDLDKVKKRLAADKHDIDQLPQSQQEESPVEEYQGPKELDLPDPELGNLKYLEELLFRASRSVFGRDLLTQAVERTNFIQKLLPLFETSEDLEDSDSLYALSSILRSLIFLNESSILEYILRDDVFMTVLGILEYDREFPNLKANHREHFEKHAQFKQIIPIRNPAVRDKINQTYRVQYLREVALARLLDDGTFTALLSMSFFNQVEVIQYIKQDAAFLKDLFALLASTDTPEEKKKQAVSFLHELCSVIKNLQSMNKGLFFRHCDPEGFHRSLINHGLFTVLSEMLFNEDVEIRTAIVAITSHVLEHDANIVRTLTQAQSKSSEQRPFMELLIDRFLEEPDAGLRPQLSDMIRTLLDTAPLDTAEGIVAHATSTNAMDDFLQLFHDRWIGRLVKPLLELNTEGHLRAKPDGTEVFVLDPDLATVCYHLCDLLCFMVKQHAVRIKYLCMTTPVMPKVALLLRAKETYLRLSALRVFRVALGMKDEFYITQVLLKNEIIESIMKAFLESKQKNNLLNSACLEMFETIRKDNPKALVARIVTKYRKELEAVDYVSTTKKLVEKYEQNIDPNREGDKPDEPTLNKTRPQDGWSRARMEEEAWFNTSDEEDETSPTDVRSKVRDQESTSPPKGRERRGAIEFVRASPDVMPPRPLVDYPEEDDDDVIGALAKGKASVEGSSPKITPSSPSPGPIRFSLGGAKGSKRARSEDEEPREQPSKREKLSDKQSAGTSKMATATVDALTTTGRDTEGTNDESSHLGNGASNGNDKSPPIQATHVDERDKGSTETERTNVAAASTSDVGANGEG